MTMCSRIVAAENWLYFQAPLEQSMPQNSVVAMLEHLSIYMFEFRVFFAVESTPLRIPQRAAVRLDIATKTQVDWFEYSCTVTA